MVMTVNMFGFGRIDLLLPIYSQQANVSK